MITEIEYKRVNLLRSTFERKYSMLFAKLLNAQFKSVASKINETNYTEPPLSVIKEDDVRKLFVSLYQTVGSHFASQTYRTHKGLKQDEDELQDRWEKYLNDYAKTQVGSRIVSITALTKEQIKKIVASIIAQSIEEGWGAEETARSLKKTLKTQGEIINGWRSLRIARTEVMTSSNVGSLLAAREWNMPTDKIWIATLDNRTRDVHRAMNNKAVDINEPFDVSGIPMECPGDPDGLPEDIINCRCGLAYKIRR